MENFTFRTPTEYIFGHGAENNAGAMSLKYLGDRIMIVYGRGSAVRSGLIDRVRASLQDTGIEISELSGIRPNPIDADVYRGIEAARKNNITGLLAVGGGSVIDTAKAIAAGTIYDGDFWDFYDGSAKIAKALPVGVVLTIPAAGSEGSGNSVITRVADKRKISMRAPETLRPRFALMNPELTFTLPPYQTACGIVDMMAHIMERYFSPTAGVEITDHVSEGVLQTIIEVAPRVMADPTDYNARANIMWSGTLAHNGVCGTGRVEDWMSHGLEHELSAIYDVAHGAGLAVVFPAWMKYAAERRPEKIARFARRVMGVADSSDMEADALEGIRRLQEFFTSLGMPSTLSGLGIESPDIETLVRSFHRNKGANPGGYIKLTSDDTRAIYNLMRG